MSPNWSLLYHAHVAPYVRHPGIWSVVFLRLGAALYFLVDPLWGYLASIVFDIVDSRVWVDLVGMSHTEYHIWDKFFDWLTYIVMVFVGFAYSSWVGLTLLLLLVWRSAGMYQFYRTLNRGVFVAYPNMIDVFYIWFVLGPFMGFTAGLSDGQVIVGLLVTVIIKVAHESFHHVLYDIFFAIRVRTRYYDLLSYIGIYRTVTSVMRPSMVASG